MTIAVVGPWVLLVLGTAGVVTGMWTTLRGRQGAGPFLLLVFGALLAGVGVYGPVFLGSYDAFVKAVVPMTTTADRATYSQAFDKVGSGALSPNLADLALSYALRNPIAGMDTLLDSAAHRASDPDGARSLETARAAFQAQQRAAAEAASAILAAPNPASHLESLDPTTRALVARRLDALPDTTLRRAGIARGELSGMIRMAAP
ncbi:MAG TPA: hypothetical protein VMH88_15800 [Gemmatimonadales bacterium]|nr:hypothetical protein [Gemmatimonadales bacterium]